MGDLKARERALRAAIRPDGAHGVVELMAGHGVDNPGFGPSTAIVHERYPGDTNRLTAPEVADVYALRLAAVRGQRMGKRFLHSKLNDEQLRLWHELALAPAIMLQDRLMATALNGVREECLPCLGAGRVRGEAGYVPCGRCRGKGWVRAAADPRIIKLAHDAALDVKDRTLGKPTERVQIAQAVKVIMGGVDPGRLPEPEPPTLQDAES